MTRLLAVLVALAAASLALIWVVLRGTVNDEQIALWPFEPAADEGWVGV